MRPPATSAFAAAATLLAMVAMASCLLIDDYGENYTLLGNGGSSNASQSSSSAGSGGDACGGAGGDACGGAGGEGGTGCRLVENPGMANVLCEGKSACQDPPPAPCPNDTFCHVKCAGEDACKDITVNCVAGQACLVTCEGINACSGNFKLKCKSASSCVITCGENSCGGGNATIKCGDGACGAICARQDSITVSGCISACHCEATTCE